MRDIYNRRNSIQWIQQEDIEYPEKLRPYKGMPKTLYVLGGLPDPSRPSVAVVGARRSTSYGDNIARQFSAELAANGIHYEDRNGLVFEVEDDGIGMDEAELAAVRAKLTLEPEEELALIGSGGFGLHNVAQRIQMYYGDQAEILVESEKNIGTCFKVYLGNQKKT